jgi:hypothetical protein
VIIVVKIILRRDKMQKDIEKIKFVFENCESVTIEGKYIGRLFISDIKYSIQRIACNAIREMQSCNHFSISINRKADNAKDKGLFGNFSRLDRINMYSDITSIYVYLNDQDEPKQFYVDWDGDDYTNQNQKVYINKFGDLFLVIDSKKTIDDVFDKEEIEDKENMNFEWSMFE